MTSLYDTAYPIHYEEPEKNFEVTEYDLDVVDEALLNPNNSEYIDHFGFKIHVKTDDECTDSDSDTTSISKDTHSIIPRPSQSYHQRQVKHTIQPFIGTPRSSESNNRSFNKLVSTFKRFSHQDHQFDSQRHAILKQETLDELSLWKEKGGIQNNNINWDFWSSVIQDFSGVIDSQMDDLRYHLSKGGIPSLIRGLVWQFISKSRDHHELEITYKQLLQQPSSFEKQIQRDLKRTFPTHPYFMQESGRLKLFRVAKAYSLFDQEVGYCQGLAFIIGCLLLHMAEEEAFCVLVSLMGKYGLRGHFTPRMQMLHLHMYQFDHVFQQKSPVVHRHLENEGITPSMYASQWFMTLFAYRCPIEFVFRVIDLLLLEGTQVLIQIALALIIRNQEKILKLRFESLIDFLCHGIFDVFGKDENAFVEDVYRVDLPARYMARLAQQYMGSNLDKEDEEGDRLKKINGVLTDHIRSVEHQLRSLKNENQDITQDIIDSKMEIASNEDEKQQLKHELTRIKGEFELFKVQIKSTYETQIQDLLNENDLLQDRNSSLNNQLKDTETMLIDLKISVAEREIEYENLKRQLLEIKKVT